jgi:hypothetical protein
MIAYINAVILHPILHHPIQVMLRKFTYLLSALCLIWATTACKTSTSDKEAKGSESTPNTNKDVEVLPSTLENSDITYYGLFKGARTQMNLRRYGISLSGNWWMSEETEVQVSGTIKGESEGFDLEVINAKGDKIGHLVGNFDGNGALRSTWRSDKDSSAITFLPMARNVKVFRIKTEELKTNKNSQNNKRQVSIIAPQIAGIEDAEIAKRVNGYIDAYFSADTWADSLEKGKIDFKEEVRYNEMFFNNEYISVSKHHHLDKNEGGTLFDDSHGITINFKRGKVYELRDLFKPNAIDALNRVILARINKSCNNSLSSNVLDKCKVKGEEKTSFFLSKSKITFHLTERLPSASRGCGYVRIEYKDLIDFINPSGPLAEHLPQRKSRQE